jgi:hypothetical protein
MEAEVGEEVARTAGEEVELVAVGKSYSQG